MDNQTKFAEEFQKLHHALSQEVQKSIELQALVQRQAEDIYELNNRIATGDEVYTSLSTLNQ